MTKSARVRIRGRWWKLVIKRLAPIKKEGQWRCLHGLCNYDERTIYLNPQFDMKATLRHEITHACQPDLDELTVDQIEDAHINADKVFEKLVAKNY